MSILAIGPGTSTLNSAANSIAQISSGAAQQVQNSMHNSRNSSVSYFYHVALT